MRAEESVKFEMVCLRKMLYDLRFELNEEHQGMLFAAQEALAWVLGAGGQSIVDLVQREMHATKAKETV